MAEEQKPEVEEETHPYKLSRDGDAIIHLTDVWLLQEDLLYDYGIELTEEECRKILSYVVKNYVQEDKPLDRIAGIVHEVFPEKFKKPVKPRPGPHYKEKEEEPSPEPEPEPELPKEEGGEGQSQS